MKAEISFNADGSPYIEFSMLSSAERSLIQHTRARLGLSHVKDDSCYLGASNSAAADAEVASWTAGVCNKHVGLRSQRLYIRVPGCSFWCVPIRAVEGQSIETYCNGRSPQRDPVEVATEPSIWERCTACELAADEVSLRGRDENGC